MAQIEILAPGMMMTVQDTGRRGLLRYGVSGSGAMDAEALAVATALVGNDRDAAALEFAHFGGRVRLTEDRMIAVCGDVGDLRIDGTPVRPWQSHLLRRGQELSIGAMRETVWGYLAIAGGVAVPEVLGARATHLRSHLGGHQGRALVAGDSLPLGTIIAEPRPRALRRPWRGRTGPVHVVMGPQDDRFAPEVIATFLSQPFRVSAQRDRMAMVLDGPLLPAADGHDIVSDGTLFGSIQVPGSGRPLVLMADRQTTGGYPKIATVAGIDRARLAQMPTGRAFRFRCLPPAEAEARLIARAEALAQALAALEAPPPAG